MEPTPELIVVVINYVVLTLLLYAGAVGTALTFIEENSKLHSWVQRHLLPFALTIVSILIAVGIITGGMVGFIIARSVL